MLLAVLWVKLVNCEFLPTAHPSENISQINNLKVEELPKTNFNPRLREALLKVLAKLKDEDQLNGQESVNQDSSAMKPVFSEEDFFKSIQKQGLEQEFLNTLQSTNFAFDETESPNLEEMLSFISENIEKEHDKPFTFATYTNKTHVTNTTDFVLNIPEQYSPSLDGPSYFQIPKPINISDSSNEDDNEEQVRYFEFPGSADIHELNTNENADDASKNEEDSLIEEERVNFIQRDEPDKTTMEEELLAGSITEEKSPSVYKPSDDEIEELAKTQVDVEQSNGTLIENPNNSGNSSMKMKVEKHEVEFLHSPLLAAFTVQQDQQGNPTRVIPLNYHQSSGELLRNNKEQQHISVKEQERQEQQIQEHQYNQFQNFVRQRENNLLDNQQQLFFNNQKYQYKSDPRLVLLRQQQQNILFQKQQEDFQNQNVFQQENRLFQNNNQQNINFQKSIDLQYHSNYQQPPTFSQPLSNFQNSFSAFNVPFQKSPEFHRVNRHEPSSSIGNFGVSTYTPNFNVHTSGQQLFHQVQPAYIQPSNYIQSNYHNQFAQQSFPATRHPASLNGQLQSLLSSSGIVGDLRSTPNGQEDLNIVSKVLALGHGDPQYHRQQQFQASSLYSQVVEPPSRVIRPPTL